MQCFKGCKDGPSDVQRPITVQKLDSKETVGGGGQISIANTVMPSTFHPAPILLDLDSINHI